MNVKNWIVNKWNQIVLYIDIKRVQFYEKSIKSNRKKIKKLRSKHELPWKLNDALMKELVFKDKDTKQLSQAQLESAHGALGNPVFVERDELVLPIPENAQPPWLEKS